MFSVLVVDHDITSLLLLRAYLEQWNYAVSTAIHAQEALNMVRIRSYDLVVLEVHMPDISGLEILRQIDEEFHLPVIMISADKNQEIMCMKNGAQCFLAKPIEANDLKVIWQYSIWGKVPKNKSTSVNTEIHECSEGGVEMNNHHNHNNMNCDGNNYNSEDVSSSRTVSASGDDSKGSRKRLWTTKLHGCFVEAILVIGYKKAGPAKILEVMNVPGLTQGQVASHKQKYGKFMEDVLDGKQHIQCSDWIDLSYYSSIVSGNPDLFLLNQLSQERRK